MIINGWVCFLSKIELMVVMIFGAFSAITGKLRKLAASLFIFEVIVNLGTILLGIFGTRASTDSWEETLKLFKDSFDKPYGPQDYTEYEEAIDWRDGKIHALEEENRELQEKLGLKKPSRKKTTKKKEEDLDKVFGI